MDHTSHPTNHSDHLEYGWCCSWCFGCHQQWLWFMGSSLWKVIFRLLGYCASLSFPKGIDGQAEQDSHHCGPLVNSSCFNLLTRLGTNRPIPTKAEGTYTQAVWSGMLSAMPGICVMFLCQIFVRLLFLLQVNTLYLCASVLPSNKVKTRKRALCIFVIFILVQINIPCNIHD